MYIGYLSSTNTSSDSQYDNYILDNSHIYTFDSDEIKYDPEYYYTIISLNYKDGDHQDTKINCLWDASEDKSDHVFADFIGDPVTGDLKIMSHTNSGHHLDNGTPSYNYITFKKSIVHKLWFSGNHRDANILTSDNRLYNFYGDTNIYSFSQNDILPEYTVLDVYDEHNKPLGYKSGTIKCTCTINGSYYKVTAASLTDKNNNAITKAAYILFTVKVKPGSVELETDA